MMSLWQGQGRWGSTGYHLAKQGIHALLIDAFDPLHQEGSHHSETWLIRHAYLGGQTYISMAIRAHQVWNIVDTEGGQMKASVGRGRASAPLASPTECRYNQAEKCEKT
jgi:glycine/D-amino acid oxidase-like deaminating enzyme